MPQQDIMLLARRLEAARARLEELWDHTDDPDKQDQICDQLDEISRQTMRLISIRIDDDSAEYRAATEALGKANSRLTKAIGDEEKFVQAIEAVADAIGLVAQIVPK